MSKTLSKHRNLIKEFVIDHQYSYFWHDYYKSDEFKSIITKYVDEYLSSKDTRIKDMYFKDWYDADGKFVVENYMKSMLKLPEKKEFEHVIRDEFNKKFTGTNVKFEDCVKYADELREHHVETIEKCIAAMK